MLVFFLMFNDNSLFFNSIYIYFPSFTLAVHLLCFSASDSNSYHTIGAKGQWHLQITQTFSRTHKESNISKTVNPDIGLAD